MKEATVAPKKKGHHERKRMFPGARGRAPQNKKGRQAEAAARQSAWDKLTPEQKLASLDSGVTPGGDRRNTGESKKQRARIQSSIDSPKAKAKITATVPTPTGEGVSAKAQRAAERLARPGHNVRG